ncbi:MAG TPA: hypothetical protein VLL05_06165, partial [Terriglobales bacterium]|nr:hypothetical protein [Terriglobales bacterium]
MRRLFLNIGVCRRAILPRVVPALGAHGQLAIALGLRVDANRAITARAFRIRRLQEENGPTVYAIGLLGEEKARRARKALQFIAEKTGGIAFFP